MLTRFLRGRDEGQVILIVSVMSVLLIVMTAFVADLGLWWGERRGAQKDGDLAALAGITELAALVPYSSAEADAVMDAANYYACDFAKKNGRDADKVYLPPTVDGSPGSDCDESGVNLLVDGLTIEDLWTGCWGDDSGNIDTLPVNIGAPTRSFSGILSGLVDSSGIGAHARACVGSQREHDSLFPVGVPIFDRTSSCYNAQQEPLYGVECDLKVFDAESGERGWLDLVEDGSDDCSPNQYNDILDQLETGFANTTCAIAEDGTTSEDCLDAGVRNGYCVWSKTGNFMGPAMDSIRTLITPAPCNTDANNRDDFDEAVELLSGTEGTPSAVYDLLCDSPRLVALIILDTFVDTGNPPRPIRGFAQFFIEACTVTTNRGVFVLETCDRRDAPGSIGQMHLVGRFVVTLEPLGPIGPPVDWAPKGTVLDQ